MVNSPNSLFYSITTVVQSLAAVRLLGAREIDSQSPGRGILHRQGKYWQFIRCKKMLKKWYTSFARLIITAYGTLYLVSIILQFRI